MRARLCSLVVVVVAVVAAAAGSASAQPYNPQTGNLKLSESVVSPSQAVLATGSGFKALGSVDMTFESTPVRLGTFQADAAGVVTARLTVPADAVAGAHQVVATGPAPDNATLVLRAALEVRPEASSSGAPLVRTGSSEVLPLTAAGLLLILLGSGVWFVVRRRRGHA